MANHTEQCGPQDGGARAYWLQVLQAGQWRNLERIADAGTALARTGEVAQSTVYDAVRLLEARFLAGKGQTEFHDVVTFDITGARFTGAASQFGPDHVRMDLAGTMAPLLPPNGIDGLAGAEASRFLAADLPTLQETQRRSGDSVPPRAIPDAPDRRPASDTATAVRRSGTRSHLLAGVMVGAFAVGVAVSAMAPEQSGKIAAAIYERIGVESWTAETASAKAEDSAATISVAEAPNSEPESWPLAWGEESDVGGTVPARSVPVDRPKLAGNPEMPATAAARGTTPSPDMPVTVSTRSGKDLEEEHRRPAANMVAAAMAAPSVPARDEEASQPAGKVAGTSPATPAPMTEEEAYAMQASLQEPPRPYEAPGATRAPAPVQLAEAPAEDLVLTVSAREAAGRSAAFTTAVAGDVSQLTEAAPLRQASLPQETLPRAPRKPVSVAERAAYRAALADAIEHGTVDDLLTLVVQPAASVDVASLSKGAVPTNGPNLTSLLDFALLQGRPEHAVALTAQGATPSDGILKTLTRSADAAALKRIAPVLRNVGIDPDRVTGAGMTPLMQAAFTGDARGVEALLTLGADPTFETGEGFRAADFAARANHAGVQEKLVLAADQSLYTPIMFGLDWSDTLETVRPRSTVCKQVGEGFVACSLKANSWLDDTAAIIAQFDTRHGNRLVAIQVDSHLYEDADAAEVGFKRAAQLIAKVLPPDQFGFPVRDIPPDAAMFESLTPSVATGQYFQYWPDDNLRRPVYVHMKMIGYKQVRGFHRIVIGNPFRVG